MQDTKEMELRRSIIELIEELLQMSLVELHMFKREWKEELGKREMPVEITTYCMKLIDSVIKWEEQHGIPSK